MAPPPTPQGVLDLPGYDLRSAVLDSWDAFIALAADADLDAPTRLEGWRVRDVVVHLGTWDGRSALSEVLATLGTPAADVPLVPDAFNAEIVGAYGDASKDEVMSALRASRDAIADVVDSTDVDRGRRLVASAAGPLPLLTIVHGGCYELALHALDVAEATGRTCDPALLQRGIAALTDTTAGLAARSGAAAEVGIVADDQGWRFTSHPDGTWTTTRVTGQPHGPRVTGGAAALLEASSGRADPVRLVAARRLKVSHPVGLAALAPILGDIPGIPGGKGLAFAAKSLGGIGSLFRR